MKPVSDRCSLFSDRWIGHIKYATSVKFMYVFFVFFMSIYVDLEVPVCTFYEYDYQHYVSAFYLNFNKNELKENSKRSIDMFANPPQLWHHWYWSPKCAPTAVQEGGVTGMGEGSWNSTGDVCGYFIPLCSPVAPKAGRRGEKENLTAAGKPQWISVARESMLGNGGR